MKKNYLILLIVLFTAAANAQNVGIGTATPLDKLHVIGSIRASTLAGVGNRMVISDLNGTLINATGATSPAWMTTGNLGTLVGTNFIGTLDAMDFAVKTGGSAAGNERMRVLGSGQIIANTNGIFAGDVLSVYGDGYASTLNLLGNSVINGYLKAPGTALYGENQDTAISSSAIYGIAAAGAVLGRASSLWGDMPSSQGVGVRGQALNASGGIGVLGIANSQAGVQGQSAGGGDGMRAYNTANASGAGDAIFALATYGGLPFASSGIFAVSTSPTGIGVLGGLASGTTMIYAIGAGNGGAFSGTKFGVTGWVGRDSTLNAAQPPSAGGYFYCNVNAFAYVGARIGGTNYKVTGTGTAGTFVRDLQNNYRIMACPEAPEILFQDYGVGQLSSGTSTINIDPIFTKNIVVDAQHPMKVFIQLEDDCNGVYVLNKSGAGFTVKELANGTSNAKFSWSIVANRADEKDLSGNIVSINANNRFVMAPPLEIATKKPARDYAKDIESTATPSVSNKKQVR